MVSLLAAALLLVCIAIVHVHNRTDPLLDPRPLNVDQELHWPSLAHASSVFSLNALFGAYFVALLALGWAATIGIAIGSQLALVLLFRLAWASKCKSFEQFLKTRKVSTAHDVSWMIWNLLIVTQIAFAVSELLILRGVSIHAFVLTPRQGTAFCIALAVVAYLYCAIGGYAAVFKTDIAQLIVILSMCFAFLLASVAVDPAGILRVGSQPPPASSSPWSLGLQVPREIDALIEFGIGLIVGASFLLGSPDTWKRVFVASVQTRAPVVATMKLMGAGLFPFVMLIPVASLITAPEDLQTAEFFSYLHDLREAPPLMMALVLGMMGSFLSSFDSALLSATHLSLATEATRGSHLYNMKEYNYRIGAFFLTILFGFIALILRVHNPYAVGVLIAGSYALFAGVFVGTLGFRKPMQGSASLWFLAAILLFWFTHASLLPQILQQPHPSHLTLGSAGAAVFLASLLVTVVAVNWRRRRD